VSADRLPAWLPPISSCDGDWEQVLARLYSIFYRDFKSGRPLYENSPVVFDKTISVGDAYEQGFWHLVTKQDEQTGERLPDFRRAERLGWCRPAIDNCREVEVLTWENDHGRSRRTYFWLVDHDYVVVLERKDKKRRVAFFLVTAFYVEGSSGERSLRKKYEKRVSGDCS